MLSQAVETFSRAQGKAEYMAEDKYQAVKDVLVKAIPSSLGSGHRDALKSRIKYGNEYALRKRLELLMDSLSPESQGIICKSRPKFVSGFVDTRNYLTHYTDELRGKALMGSDLFWACHRLLMLIRILLLKEFGLEEEIVSKRIMKNGTLRQHIRLYGQCPECVE